MSVDTITASPAAMERGRALLSQGDFAGALIEAEQAVAAAPKDREALLLRADCALALGDVYRSADDLNQIVMNGDADPMLLDRLGAHLQELKLYDQAVVCHVRAINGAAPEHMPQLYINLGRAMMGQGNHKAAVELFETVLGAVPDSADAALNLSGALLSLKDYAGAAEACRKAIASKPTTALYHNLGIALHMQSGQREQAAEAFRKALELDPSNTGSAHMLSVASGEAMEAVPGALVANTFDGYASYYDKDVTEKLRYRVPGLIRRALTDPFYGKRRYQAILDLGCGTGLVGVMVHDVTDFLRGVDVSHNMLMQAVGKEIYHELEEADLTKSLGSDDRLYDGVVAGDVCGYIGNLDAFFANVFARMQPGGLFVFSVERHPTLDYAMQPTGRFAHGRDYVRRALEACGFTVRSTAPERLRINAGQPVDGLIVVAQRPGPGTAAPSPLNLFGKI
ncbi:tetratricopeptide repeat protein [Arenibaculum pallidiluteum]|uniref:tetratricopeptide repeat protein n=1 Tax=Arenibaculum pallidiluteum TaxID=2812559 RepID=UPI001A970B9C|nr:tetratricopeptide repeat protein [Arenibaculum pallidiluteum]